MHDHVELVFVKYPLQAVGVANVCLKELEITRFTNIRKVCALYLRGIEIVQVVNDRDVPRARAKQVLHKMRTDKSGAAGYKYVSVHWQI